jgi:choline-sulfatase
MLAAGGCGRPPHAMQTLTHQQQPSTSGRRLRCIAAHLQHHHLRGRSVTGPLRADHTAAVPLPQPRRRCNLLYIISDQHSPFVTGCYGDPVVETPTLDALAARGVVLDSCYSASPICTPARMSMLCGRHPHQTQCWGNNDHLDTGTPTFAHALGAAGYHPVLIGRMHSNGPDQLHGYAERLVGDHRGQKGVPGGTAGPYRVSLEVSGHGQSSYQVKDECATAAAIDFMNREGAKRRALPPSAEPEPFALSVGLMLPHQPFIARRGDYDKYKGRLPPVRAPPEPLERVHPHIAGWRASQNIVSVPDDEVERARTAYWALVDRMDCLIGDIMGAMRSNGLDEDTLVVYVSDHGEQAGEHGLWWKQTFYE